MRYPCRGYTFHIALLISNEVYVKRYRDSVQHPNRKSSSNLSEHISRVHFSQYLGQTLGENEERANGLFKTTGTVKCNLVVDSFCRIRGSRRDFWSRRYSKSPVPCKRTFQDDYLFIKAEVAFQDDYLSSYRTCFFFLFFLLSPNPYFIILLKNSFLWKVFLFIFFIQ